MIDLSVSDIVSARLAQFAEQKAAEWRADCVASGIRLNKYISHIPTMKQQIALRASTLELFFGGAAGGGKSDFLLMGALQYVDEPGYAALLVRRTLADLSLPGALMDRSHAWLDDTDAHWNGLTKTWTFPSGAQIAFGYLESENDKYRYRSSEFQYIAFDEVAQFSESQYLYLFSRLRRLIGANIPLRARSASNPDGEGYEWVQARFVPEAYIASKNPAKYEGAWISDANGAVFIPSLLEDNPFLDISEYDQSLLRMAANDPALYERLRWGEWGVQVRGTLILEDWFPRSRYFDALPPGAEWKVRAWDLAVGKKQLVPDPKKKRLPDFHASVKGVSWKDDLWLGGPLLWRSDITEAERKIVETIWMETALRHGVGSSNFEATTVTRLRNEGFALEQYDEPGDKVARSSGWRGLARLGRVKLVGTVEEWKPFLYWMYRWQGLDGEVDDPIDAVSGAAQLLGMRFMEDQLARHGRPKRRRVPHLMARLKGIQQRD